MHNYKPKTQPCQLIFFLLRVLTYCCLAIIYICRRKKMKEQDDFTNRKEYRRKKIKDRSYRKVYDYEDPIEKKANKNNIKKIKEDIEEEEWEDWDRYYNH